MRWSCRSARSWRSPRSGAVIDAGVEFEVGPAVGPAINSAVGSAFDEDPLEGALVDGLDEGLSIKLRPNRAGQSTRSGFGLNSRL
jgi:hypothetical protein